jgi:hypothetical protein
MQDYASIYENIKANDFRLKSKRTRASFWNEKIMKDTDFLSYYKSFNADQKKAIKDIGDSFVTDDKVTYPQIIDLVESYYRFFNVYEQLQIIRAIQNGLTLYRNEPEKSLGPGHSVRRGGGSRRGRSKKQNKTTQRRRKSYGKSKKRTRHL